MVEQECAPDLPMRESPRSLRPQPDTARDSVERSQTSTREEPPSKTYEPLAQPPEGYPDLKFLPITLRTWFLVLTGACFTGCLAGLLTLISLAKHAPEKLHLRSPAAFWVVQFAPGIIGAVTTFWWRAIVQTYNRIMPYVVLASVPVNVSAQDYRLYRPMYKFNALPALFIDYEGFHDLLRNGHVLSFTINIMLILLSMTLTPAKSAFLDLTKTSGGWQTTLTPAIGYLLVSAYAVLLVCTVIIAFRLFNVRSGLKWDPAPLASQIALIQDSNIFDAFTGTEYWTCKYFGRYLHHFDRNYGVLRLGYWRNIEDANDIIHGIRLVENDLARPIRSTRDDAFSCGPPEVQQRFWLNWGPDGSWSYSTSHFVPYFGRETPQDHDGRDLKSLVRPRYRNYFLGLIPAFYWPLMMLSVGAVILAFWAVATDRIYRPIIRPSDVETLQSLMHPDQLRTRLTLWLPVVLIVLFNIIFLPADTIYRTQQPIRGMDRVGGELAKETVLVDYLSPFLPVALAMACRAGHYRVFFYMQLASVCTSASILPGRLFGETFRDGVLVWTIQPAMFWSTLAVLLAYWVFVWFARTPPQYRTPRPLFTIYDMISLCCQSTIIDCPEFRSPAMLADEEIFKQNIRDAKRSYQFGMYLGKDGRRHLGFDVAERVDEKGNVIRPVDAFFHSPTRNDREAIERLRRPRIVRAEQVASIEDRSPSVQSHSAASVSAHDIGTWTSGTRRSVLEEEDDLDQHRDMIALNHIRECGRVDTESRIGL